MGVENFPLSFWCAKTAETASANGPVPPLFHDQEEKYVSVTNIYDPKVRREKLQTNSSARTYSSDGLLFFPFTERLRIVVQITVISIQILDGFDVPFLLFTSNNPLAMSFSNQWQLLSNINNDKTAFP